MSAKVSLVGDRIFASTEDSTHIFIVTEITKIETLDNEVKVFIKDRGIDFSTGSHEDVRETGKKIKDCCVEFYSNQDKKGYI